MLIFVYGTLRKGGGLNFKIEDDFEPIGTYSTTPTYSLYDMGVPCLSKGGTTSVLGEVYRIEDLGQIAHIHNLEVRAGYTLTKVDLIGMEESAYAYLQTPEEPWREEVIRSGDWLKFRRERELLSRGHKI